MKKIIIASLLMTSAVVFAKTENPKLNTVESKSKTEAVLKAKKNFKDENVVIKVAKAKVMNPFQQCVFNNSMSISLMYISMGIPTSEGFAEAAATASCMASFGGL
ncbi:hypothetical protein [Chryseobacterium sp. RU33C]|uniref:hypothetical protein n=1 Tax=Chryseobacterium sp. RU33C TaxID=1907398 RepID=UPI0009558CC4|nr:hypothetical protein [Chryseobacterium sp. RU33C]SIQ31723.1 hypothetical protein SAMN05880573_104156 [Chryseobacterium sp. RU33C]